MAETDASILDFVAERFRRSDEKLDRVLEAVLDQRNQLTAMRDSMVAMRADLGAMARDIAGIHVRLDNLSDRLARIEKRLDLVDVVR